MESMVIDCTSADENLHGQTVYYHSPGRQLRSANYRTQVILK